MTLIHNETAGAANHRPADLVDLLCRAGCNVAYVAYKHCDLSEALGSPADIVAVAGGDGTVGKIVAKARPDGPPLAILPLGTANNMAKSLGCDRPVGELVAGWAACRLRPFYPLDAEGPWGRRRLAEGLGFGAFEAAIAFMPSNPGLGEARGAFAAAAISTPAEHLDLRLDGERIARAFASLEITTIPLVGPNLPLARGIDATARGFAICFVGESPDERQGLAAWLAAPDGDAAAPVALRLAERATIVGQFRRVRLNGRTKATTPERDWDYDRPIAIEAAPEPVHFLVPE